MSSVEQGVIGGARETGFSATGYLVRDGLTACTAMLVEPDLVLTAAHCIEPRFHQLSFGWGEVEAMSRVHVTARAFHPRYVPPPTDAGLDFEGYDVGLMVTETPLRIPPLEMAPAPWGGRVLAVGYGATAYLAGSDGRRVPHGIGTEKRSVEGSVVGRNAIELFVRIHSGSAVCYGDSGSPLFTDDGKVVGILSRFTGTTRCRPEDRTIMAYTRVDEVSDFLREAKRCLRAEEASSDVVQRCLRDDAAALCVTPRVSLSAGASVVTPQQGTSFDGSMVLELGDAEARTLRFSPVTNVELSLVARGDAFMSVVRLPDGTPVSELRGATPLDAGQSYELVVRSCTGRRQPVTLVWRPR